METTLDFIRDLQFYQSKNGYRFSIDAVLLSEFVSLRIAPRILDLGSGSGIVGILLADRYPASHVTMVEIQKGLHSLSERNVALNGLGERVQAVREDFANLPVSYNGAFDLVVANPPYRRTRTGLESEGEERLIARHEITMSLPGLLKAAAKALKSRGRLCVVYNPNRLAELMSAMSSVGLEPKRLMFVHGRVGTEARIVLVEAVRDGRIGLKVEPPLIVYNDEGGYTDQVRAMY